MPVLEYNGRVLCQSGAILSFAGRLAGMCPADPLDAAKVDEIVWALADVTSAIVPAMFEVLLQTLTKKYISI